MGLLSGLFGGSKSSSSSNTNQYDQRQVNDTSGGSGIAGNTGTINITDGSQALLPFLRDGLSASRDAQSAVLELAKNLGGGGSSQTSLLVVAGLALVAVVMVARPR